MNPEEGALRPQLLDRFALAVDVDGARPSRPSAALAVERRLRFDDDPVTCSTALARRTGSALGGADRPRQAASRESTARPTCSSYAAHADLRARRSFAARRSGGRSRQPGARGASGVAIGRRTHVDAVLPLVLGASSRRSLAPPPGPSFLRSVRRRAERTTGDESADRPKALPRASASSRRGRCAARDRGERQAGARRRPDQRRAAATLGRGAAIRARPSADPLEIDARATIVHALASTGSARSADRTISTRRCARPCRHPVSVCRRRERLASGAASACGSSKARWSRLLDAVGAPARRGRRHCLSRRIRESRARADRPQLGRCGSARWPTCRPAVERRWRTVWNSPRSYVTDDTVLVLLTDGRANVPSRSDDAWADALTAAAAFRCTAMVIDSEDARQPTGRATAARGGAMACRWTCAGSMELIRTTAQRRSELGQANAADLRARSRRAVSARARLFVGGTSSNAGKSWMATAICAWLRRRGVSVAPFKAQNMSNNSYPCRGGGEIGRAQVAQAEACGLEPEPAMNPILLKPNGNGTSQVVRATAACGRRCRARDYYEHFDELLAAGPRGLRRSRAAVRRRGHRRRRQRQRAEPARRTISSTSGW